jgi:predicted ferric reductase
VISVTLFNYSVTIHPHEIKNFNVINSKKMGNLLYIVAVILIIAWLIGFIGYSAGGIIHILLVIAVIAILVQVIQGRKL